MAELKYDVQETFGVLSESPKGWRKEVRSISWNGREPKFDIREWAPNDEKMGKGVTLSREEIKNLREILNRMDL